MKKIFVILVLCLLSSCASIISGTTTTINISPSDSTISPDGIRVETISKSGVQVLTLPTIINVKRSGKPIIVNVKDKCFRETTYSIQPNMNPWFLGNIITGGTTGTSTDALSGALWTYDDAVIIPVISNGTCK